MNTELKRCLGIGSPPINLGLDNRRLANTFPCLRIMKIAFFTGLTLAAALALQAADPAAVPGAAPSTNTFKPNTPLAKSEANDILKNDVDKLSYSFGLN